MPSLFYALGYKVYFWSNEGKPLEPVHVHVSKGNPSSNATKFWIYSDGSVHLDTNNSKISQRTLNQLSKLLEVHSDEILFAWKEYFKCEPIFKDLTD